MNKHEYYCRHQQQQEENTKRWIEDYFEKDKQKQETKKVAREEAKQFIDSQRQKIEIEVDKQSIAEVERALKSIF